MPRESLSLSYPCNRFGYRVFKSLAPVVSGRQQVSTRDTSVSCLDSVDVCRFHGNWHLSSRSGLERLENKSASLPVRHGATFAIFGLEQALTNSGAGPAGYASL